MSKQSFTPISETGRYKLIKSIAKKFATDHTIHPSVVKGIGDDAAVMRKNDLELNLQSTETYVEGVDFDLTYTPLNHLGYKIISAAVSDILAMNGKPETLLLSIGMPNKISTEMIDIFYDGVKKACEVFGCTLSGGDITASPSVLILSVTVNGMVKESEITYRSGAQKDDAVCITGDLGGAYAGLRILLREKSVWAEEDNDQDFQPNLENYEYVIKRQLVPEARLDLIETLAANDILPTSMIDISKNLLLDIQQLLSASRVGATIYQAAIPIALETRSVADEFQDDVSQYALQGGEDYELLFTLPEKEVNKLINHFKDFVVIGKINHAKEGFKMQTADGDLMHFDASEMK